ncbi:MAG: tRNA dihydrouridine(20/20a) synthase DusA [Gammaproteobacteria bacterium]
MMDWTDRHERYFLRLLTRQARLYTEMVTTQALKHGHKSHLLDFDPLEHPIALQVGGSDPQDLAYSARLAEEWGYDEINLNVGCPSDRVQKGRIGACLMAEPQHIAECVAAMKAAVSIPVTVKTRIGIDHQDDEAFLFRFVEAVQSAQVDLLIVHARKAWLSGLSPKENREKPPLNYQRVLRIKQQWPALPVVINGGINTPELAQDLLSAGCDGVMIGRTAYQSPYSLANVDHCFFGTSQPPLSRLEVIQAFIPYLEQAVRNGIPIKHITRHLTGLFQACPGGRRWRRCLSENATLTPQDVLEAARCAQNQLDQI